MLERLDAVCPAGLQAPAGGSLDIDLTDPVTGALRATVHRGELERLVRRGCPRHGTAAGSCRCPVQDRPARVGRYAPSPAQRRFLRARDRTCRHPGCRRPAARTDLDHVVPHAAGGTTDCTNLCCLCRRYHRLETHAPGWRYRMTPDGTLLVTTPSGITPGSSDAITAERLTYSPVVTLPADHAHPDSGDAAAGPRPPGVSLAEVIAALEARYDPVLAESWDAVGLVCGDPEETVRSVLFAVDPASAVVDEAIATGADLVVTHHPLLLTPVHGVPAGDPKGRLVHRLVRAGVALFTAHTNADRATGGVNDALAAVLGLVDPTPLEPVAGDPRSGLGRVGALPGALTLREFAELVAGVLPVTAGGVRIAGDPDRRVRTVAVCGGSGGSLLDAATAAGADVLLTSDLKHHAAADAGEAGGAALVDVAHYASEWPWLPVAADLLHRDLGARVGVAVSACRTDPWTAHVAGGGNRAAHPSAGMVGDAAARG